MSCCGSDAWISKWTTRLAMAGLLRVAVGGWHQYRPSRNGGPCTRCDDAAMTEYGHGVAEGAGQFSGSNGGGVGGGGGGDWGAAMGNAVGDAVQTITALPA